MTDESMRWLSQEPARRSRAGRAEAVETLPSPSGRRAGGETAAEGPLNGEASRANRAGDKGDHDQERAKSADLGDVAQGVYGDGVHLDLLDHARFILCSLYVRVKVGRRAALSETRGLVNVTEGSCSGRETSSRAIRFPRPESLGYSGSGFPPPRLGRRLVELGIAAENARFIEGNPPVRGEIGGDARERRDRSGQRGNRRIEPAGVGERVRERISQACPDLEQRQIDSGEVGANCVGWSRWVGGEHPFEIAEILRRPMLQKRGGARLGLFSLVLVVKLGRDRMMGVVNFRYEIGDRELEPMDEEAARLVLRRESEPGAKVVENV